MLMSARNIIREHHSSDKLLEAGQIFTKLASNGDDQSQDDDLLPSAWDAVLDSYEAAQQRRYEQGEIGATRWGAIRRSVGKLRTWFKDKALPEDEQGLGRLLSEFREDLEARLTAGEIKRSTFDDRIRDLRHFIEWGSSTYRLSPLPRNSSLVFRKFNDAAVDRGAKAIDVETLRKLWQKADSRLRLCMALALNCGFYASDIGGLTPEQFTADGQLNFVRRKTERKAHKGHGVRVVYKLWPVTQKLVNKHLNTAGELAFTDKNDNPLYTTYSSGVRDDRIYRMFAAVRDQLGIEGVSFDNLRDTGATLVEQIDQRWTDTYLAHVDNRIARRYVDAEALDHEQLYADLAKVTDQVGEKLSAVFRDHDQQQHRA